VTLPRSALFSLAGTLYDYQVTWRRIPGALRARLDLGPAAALLAFAQCWRRYRTDGAWPEQISVEPRNELPAAAAMGFFQTPNASSSHARPGFVPANLTERVRQQSWTYREFAAPPS
ncbi:MAG: hypothetical protein HUU35_13765, partial [Armatimonadetes bacterium]|nr:hypothetical protein [Armatimonadota bacterium]